MKILLKQVRMGKKLSMNDMARITGLSPQYLGKLERSQGNPSMEVIDKLCSSLDVQVGDLLIHEKS